MVRAGRIIKKKIKVFSRAADKVIIRQRRNGMDAKQKATLEAMNKASERAAQLREARERFLAMRREV